MKLTQVLLLFQLSSLLLTFTYSGCSTPGEPISSVPRKPTSSQIEEEDSFVDIQYVLGRGHYRFTASSESQNAKASTFLDKQPLESRKVDLGGYRKLLRKISEYVQTSLKDSSLPSISLSTPCKTPFTVTLRVGNTSQISNGCRSNDKGNLSKLLREAEFLLYSKK